MAVSRIVLVVALLAISWEVAESCSCIRQHPQTQYCDSDFVVVATVKRQLNPTADLNSYENVYKIKIRKEFKMSQKARVALKSGRLITPSNDGLCGISLDIGETYLLTGRVFNLQAHVNLCNYYQPWKNVTPRQRKGFRLLYKQGCHCRIRLCHSQNGCPGRRAKDICNWENPFSDKSCHASFGICFINKDGLCHWAKAPRLSECLRNEKLRQLTYV